MSRNGELAIYEVYYYEDGSVQGYGEAVAYPAGETLADLRVNCDLYIAALEKPILKYT